MAVTWEGRERTEMLQQKLKELAELYLGLEIIKTAEQSQDEKVKALPEYQALENIREGKKQQESDIENLRAEVKNLTMEAYLETDNKKPAPGVGIRVLTKYEYDETKAFDYCLHDLPEALKLDARKFEKYVKGVQDVKPLPFVSVEEYPTATIASDLTEYLDV